MTTRCFAVVGTAWTGPAYCGHPAKTEDVNGRPICGVHRRGIAGIAWYGDRYRYPEGTGGTWKFAHGPKREPDPPRALPRDSRFTEADALRMMEVRALIEGRKP
jgi:hypothetical protein